MHGRMHREREYFDGFPICRPDAVCNLTKGVTALHVQRTLGECTIRTIPGSKTLASETSSLEIVMPCDLWMVMAHASRNGTCKVDGVGC
jgi:hypothetical protein